MESLTNIGRIKELSERYGFSFQKSLGQNFLINPTVCPKIAEYGNAASGWGILEIGAGFGVLTVELAKRADKVCVVEIDDKLLPVLAETLSEFENIKIIHQDILKTDIRKLIETELKGLSVAVCANLPYYLTSEILMVLLEQRLPIDSITVMVQKEAAERLCAQMGTRACSAVTAAVYYYSEPKLLFEVSRGSFMPAPKVDSAVIRLDIRKVSPWEVKDEAYLFRLIRGAFSQRRKTLPNPLSGVLQRPKSEIQAVMESLGISPLSRAEALSMEDFISLSNALYQG